MVKKNISTMEKLIFGFEVKASEDEKSNKIFLTSIMTQDNKRYVMPKEYQNMNLHTLLGNTSAYNRIKSTFKKRHQKRNVWITLSGDLKLIYLDEDENLIFGEYYLEEVEETKTNENTENKENAMSKLFEKLMLQQQNSDKENLQKISEKFILGKFSTKSSNVYQWVQEFENECKHFKIDQDRKKIEVLKLFLEKSGLDWYGSMLIKLTIDSHWETWKKIS